MFVYLTDRQTFQSSRVWWGITGQVSWVPSDSFKGPPSLHALSFPWPLYTLLTPHTSYPTTKFQSLHSSSIHTTIQAAINPSPTPSPHTSPSRTPRPQPGHITTTLTASPPTLPLCHPYYLQPYNIHCLPMWLLYWGCLTPNKKAVWSVKTIPTACITSQKTALFSNSAVRTQNFIYTNFMRKIRSLYKSVYGITKMSAFNLDSRMCHLTQEMRSSSWVLEHWKLEM